MRDVNVTWQPRRVDCNVHVWTMTTSLYLSVGVVDTIEWARVLCSHHVKNNWVEQWICIKFGIKLKHSSAETIWMIQKVAATGNWWLAASSQECIHSCIPSHAEIFVKHQITQVTQPPYSPDLAPCNFWLFPKLKSSLKKREEISDHWQDSGKYDRAAHSNWRDCVGSQGNYFEGDRGVIVLCTMFLVSVSSSINISIFHSTCLDTFWTDLI